MRTDAGHGETERTSDGRRGESGVRERAERGGHAAVAPPRAAARANWRRATGIAGAAIGVVAAGAAAGVAVERLTVGRGDAAKARLALDAAGPYGSLRGTPGTAFADDGTELYYEVDEVDAGRRARRARAAAGSSAARPPRPSPSSSATATASARTPGTSSGPRCAASVRTVHWDQRSHGRSGRGRGPGRRTAAGHHRPARPRPEGRHRRGGARGARSCWSGTPWAA